MIKIGDNTVEYDRNFRMYITTKLTNPHYPPELCVKVNLLNFMATAEGLQDQMLGIVVAKEEPELEMQREKLVLEVRGVWGPCGGGVRCRVATQGRESSRPVSTPDCNPDPNLALRPPLALPQTLVLTPTHNPSTQDAENKRQLKEIEDTILFLLKNSKGNILDDELLIDTLAQSKVTSNNIEQKVKEAAKTQEIIARTRLGYVPVAYRVSQLFFCIADLGSIDPMYQYSLEWCVSCLQSQPPTPTPKA